LGEEPCWRRMVVGGHCRAAAAAADAARCRRPVRLSAVVTTARRRPVNRRQVQLQRSLHSSLC